MRKVISCMLILIVQMWSFSTPGAIFVQLDVDENIELKSEAVDSSKVSDGLNSISEEASNINVDEIEMPDENKSEQGGPSILGLIGLILGVLSLGLGVYLLFELRKNQRVLCDQVSACETSINALKEKGEKEIINEKVHVLESEINSLRREMEAYRRVTEEYSQNAVKSVVQKNNYSGSTRPQSPYMNGKPIKKEVYQTTYVSALTMDDEGSLNIPIWSLEPDNNEALFRIKLDNSKGIGFYELNPNVRNLVPLIDMLKAYADGVVPSKNNGYATVTPGNLKRVGQDLKVVTKLIVG